MTPTRDVPWSFWTIGTVALLWYLMGSLNFLAQMNPDVVAAMPATHRAIIEGRPFWATATFGIGVFGGALGCVLLLLRRSAAIPVFAVSLLGVVVTTMHTVRVAGASEGFGVFEIVMMIASSPIVGAFLLWYAKQTARRDWIRASAHLARLAATRHD